MFIVLYTNKQFIECPVCITSAFCSLTKVSVATQKCRKCLQRLRKNLPSVYVNATIKLSRERARYGEQLSITEQEAD